MTDNFDRQYFEEKCKQCGHLSECLSRSGHIEDTALPPDFLAVGKMAWSLRMHTCKERHQFTWGDCLTKYDFEEEKA